MAWTSDRLAELKAKLKSGELVLHKGKVFTPDEWAQIKKAKSMEELFDLLQLTKKISMNSLYGALLNKNFRFGDERLGASVTGSGRQITTHMVQTIAYKIETIDPSEKVVLVKRYAPVKTAGGGNHADSTTVAKMSAHEFFFSSALAIKEEYDHMAVYRAMVIPADVDPISRPEEHKSSQDTTFRFAQSIIYGDTDSCYFKCLGATTNAEAVELADSTAEFVNDSFDAFTQEAFLTQPEFTGLIKAEREVVATRGLFQAKKKYILKVFNQDGREVSKIKSMGSEIKKADTPKVIQKFLKTTVDKILEGESYLDVAEYVNSQRKAIMSNTAHVFDIGVAKQVNDMDKYGAEYRKPGSITTVDVNGKRRKLTIPGHVRAALNYNFLVKLYEEGGKEVRGGDKVLVYYVKQNDFNFKAVAVPADHSKFPVWFSDEFAVDVKMTESKMFDNKLTGIFSAWGYSVPTPREAMVKKLLSF